MYIKKITSKSDDLYKVHKLYIKSFPENEHNDFSFLLNDNNGLSEIFAFYDKDIFLGFMSLLTYGDISHILYFAIDNSLRYRGYGSEALRLLKDIKPNYRILADIEVKRNEALNNEEREKRKKFYIKNGYTASEIKYEWQNEYYEILVYGGSISKKEFVNFWSSILEINIELSKF